MKQSDQGFLTVHTRTLVPLNKDIESVCVCSGKKISGKKLRTFLGNLPYVKEVLQKFLKRLQRKMS